MAEQVKPGQDVYFDVAAAHGLLGTLGVAVTNAAGTATVTPRTTAGITEPAHGDYVVHVVAPDTVGEYRVVVDDAAGNITVFRIVVTYTPFTADTGDAFASADDLAVRLGLTFDSDETARATTLLERASDLIREETGQHISLVTDDTLSRRSVTDERLRLPQRPVVSIASVTLTPQSGDASLVDSDSYYLEGDELVRAAFPVRAQQFFTQWTRGWLGPLWQIEVVYTHGYATVPELVRAIALEMVVRVWVNPGSVIQATVAGTETAYAPYGAPPRGLLLTDEEKRQLNALLRRTSGSIPLR